MGVVYEAEDTKLGRHVALKFLSREAEEDSTALERFKQEARAASALNHPNICTIYAIEECDGQWFIAMELLEGESLSEKIQGIPLPLDEDAGHRHPGHRCARCGPQQGNRAPRHQAGEHLRDQPRAGQDPGFRTGQAGARPPLGDGDGGSRGTTMAGPQLTSPGSAVGTVAYMSPEQARGDELDGRSDLFSMGAVLYEMATGRIPVRGQDLGGDFPGNHERKPVPPAQLNPSIPPKMEEIIDKALEKDADLRYQSAAEMRGDLKRLKRDSDASRGSGTQRRPEPVPAVPSRHRRPRRPARRSPHGRAGGC